MPREEDDDGAADICRTGLPAQEAPDPPRTIPGADGLPGSLATAGGAYPAPLSPSGARPPALPPVGDAASPCRPTLLQPERPGDGRPPFSRGQALLYEAESVRRFAGLRMSEPIPDESTILHFRHPVLRRGRLCWNSTNWARGCLRRSKTIWQRRGCG